MDDVLSLVAREFTPDANGVPQAEETAREVFCKVGSVTRSEFYTGGRAGLNPEFVFTVFSADYMGESVIIYGGKSYAVYRTYLVPDSDYIELYAQREGGTNGKENAHC